MDERTLQIVLRARDEASKTLRGVEDSTDSLTKAFKANFAQAGLMAGGVLAGLAAMTGAAIKNAASYEQNRIAFESMLGSASKAQDLLEQVSAFARKTPFELPQVVEGSKRLLAYGIAQKDIITRFRMLGDIAAGVGTDKLPQLITAFGQVQAKGRLMGTELLQFTEAGVNLGGQLAKSFGVSRVELEKMISSGQVTSEQVTQALQTMTSQGGLFFQGMERQAGSFNGIMSNIRDTFGKMVREIVGMSESGDVREGSIFYYFRLGAERLLPLLEELTPKIVTIIEAFLKNKDALLAIAGAITGLLILALGALVVAFGPVLLVMAAFAAAGAFLFIEISRLIDLFNVWKPVVIAVIDAAKAKFDEFLAKVRSVIEAGKAAIAQLPEAVRMALGTMWEMIKNFNPIIRIGLELPNLNNAFEGIKRLGKMAGIPGYAEGTSFAPGGLALVGERGPELVNLPRGSQVFPSQQTQQMLGGPALHIDQVIVRDQSDIDSLAHRLAFSMKTRGNL